MYLFIYIESLFISPLNPEKTFDSEARIPFVKRSKGRMKLYITLHYITFNSQKMTEAKKKNLGFILQNDHFENHLQRESFFALKLIFFSTCFLNVT